MPQLWAIVSESGDFVLRYTDSPEQTPEDSGHADECVGCNIWPLECELVEGEIVSFETGEILFNAALAAPSLVAEIKAVAQQRILEVAPLWRQVNDLAEPDRPGVAERRAQIQSIREWSDELEAMVTSATNATQLADVRSALNNHSKT